VTVTINALPGAPSAGNVIACFDGYVHIRQCDCGRWESVVWYTLRRWQCDHAPTGTLWELTLRMRRPRSLRPDARGAHAL
jgi:hypothetical protein